MAGLPKNPLEPQRPDAPPAGRAFTLAELKQRRREIQVRIIKNRKAIDLRTGRS